MAESDWTVFPDNVDNSKNDVDFAATSGTTPPNGGGTFTLGFNSINPVTGAVGYYANAANFAPIAAGKGGSMRAALKRGVSAGTSGWSAGMAILLEGPQAADYAYVLGLSNADSSHIVLYKGPLNGGIPDTGAGVLRKSTDIIAPGTWVQLRIDAQVNQNGDVILACFQSDLTANTVDAPDWQPIDGIELTTAEGKQATGHSFTDDALGVNSGNALVSASKVQPFTNGGYMGLFYHCDGQAARRAYFDYIQVRRQL